MAIELGHPLPGRTHPRIEWHGTDDLDDLACAFAVHVPTENGTEVTVEVFHNHVRKAYEVEFTEALLTCSPQGITAVVQLAMLTIQTEVDH